MDDGEEAEHRDPLFSVVHDPVTDRFFLQEREDNCSTRGNQPTASTSAPSFPWEQLVLPARSITSTWLPSSQPDANASPSSPTRRANRPASTSPAIAAMLSALSELNNDAKTLDTAIKWNGEPLSVRVVGLAAVDFACLDERSRDVLDPQPTAQSTENAQWLAHTFDLKQLARIRPAADGFRDRDVNIGSRFTSGSDSEPEELDEEEEEGEEASSSDERELPVFQRGDRVRFRLAGALVEFSGRVVDRVHRSVFYDVRGSDSRVFKSVYAGNMSLRPAKERKLRAKPRYVFSKHDKVLWLQPQEDQDESEMETYKARVLSVRSLDRFDLLLRTGRVVKRVPHDQLRPRDAF